MPDEDEARRRVKAARAYAGLSVPDLGKAIGIGERTLRSLEGPAGRPFRTMELNAIAEACGVPRDWFSVPFQWLGEAEVVSVDLQIPEDPTFGTLFAEFAGEISIQNARGSSPAFIDTAHAVMERGGRLFWWTRQETSVVFQFARLIPGGIGPQVMSPEDARYVRVAVVQDLLNEWMAAALWAHDSLSKGRPARVSQNLVATDTLLEDVIAASNRIVEAVIVRRDDEDHA